MEETLKEWETATVQLESGIKKSKKAYTFNVIHFIPQGEDGGESANKLKKVASLCDGRYRTLAGVKEIKSFIGVQLSD
jgi:hypothetical protein